MHRLAVGGEHIEIAEALHPEDRVALRLDREAQFSELLLELFLGDGLHHIAAGAQTHRVARVFVVTRDEDDVHLGVDLFELFGELHAIHAAHMDIKERDITAVLPCFLKQLALLMKRLGDGTSDSEIENLKDKQNELEMLRRNSFFRGIGLFDGFRQQSMVLQQRSGYSQVYRYWIMLQNGLDLIQGDTSVGVQPIWRLYELWCFLKVKQLVCKVLGIDVHNKEHLEKFVHEDTQNAFDLFNGGTLSGHITYTNPDNGDLVEVGYQYSFGRKGDEHEMRSATIEQRPDIVMHIHKKNRDITLTYLYDAKYSVRGDDDATLGDVQDEPKPETINAMHHYRNVSRKKS